MSAWVKNSWLLRWHDLWPHTHTHSQDKVSLRHVWTTLRHRWLFFFQPPSSSCVMSVTPTKCGHYVHLHTVPLSLHWKEMWWAGAYHCLHTLSPSAPQINRQHCPLALSAWLTFDLCFLLRLTFSAPPLSKRKLQKIFKYSKYTFRKWPGLVCLSTQTRRVRCDLVK